MTESPGFSTFVHDDGAVYNTYSTTWRGLEFPISYYPILDHAPKGRDEGKRRGSSGFAGTTSTTVSREPHESLSGSLHRIPSWRMRERLSSTPTALTSLPSLTRKT